jgi:hypothetical protein
LSRGWAVASSNTCVVESWSSLSPSSILRAGEHDLARSRGFSLAQVEVASAGDLSRKSLLVRTSPFFANFFKKKKKICSCDGLATTSLVFVT